MEVVFNFVARNHPNLVPVLFGIPFHSWMLSNESIPGTEGQSIVCFSIKHVMTILFH